MSNSKLQADPEYDAFISYSGKDAFFVEKLEKALESYKPAKDLKVDSVSLLWKLYAKPISIYTIACYRK